MDEPHEFYLSPVKRAGDLANGITPYVIGADGKAVIWKRGNGQHTFMQYRTRRGAEQALRRVRGGGFPGAYIAGSRA